MKLTPSDFSLGLGTSKIIFPWVLKSVGIKLVACARPFAISIRYRHRVGNDLRSGKESPPKMWNLERFLEMAGLPAYAIFHGQNSWNNYRPSKNLTCPPRKGTISRRNAVFQHLPTINFQDLCEFSGGVNDFLFWLRVQSSKIKDKLFGRQS